MFHEINFTAIETCQIKDVVVNVIMITVNATNYNQTLSITRFCARKYVIDMLLFVTRIQTTY